MVSHQPLFAPIPSLVAGEAKLAHLLRQSVLEGRLGQGERGR